MLLIYLYSFTLSINFQIRNRISPLDIAKQIRFSKHKNIACALNKGLQPLV
uniref:Uncharacterized protein n=1 Tax=Kuenenia stuttgartiensis TaxID=174633 RepID=Q1Q0N5_KUEST|nr:unknown protein [Candidatus Kuenenia stuttgartiensis]